MLPQDYIYCPNGHLPKAVFTPTNTAPRYC